jgi:hypothetical protein
VSGCNSFSKDTQEAELMLSPKRLGDHNMVSSFFYIGFACRYSLKGIIHIYILEANSKIGLQSQHNNTFF